MSLTLKLGHLNAPRDITPANPSGLLTQAFVGLVSEMSSFKGLYTGDEFSALATYASGDIVSYQGEVYKFNQSHTPAAWDAADADLVLYGDVKVNGTHTFTTNGFYEVFINDQEAKHLQESMGSKYKRGSKVKVELEHPDGGPKAASFFARVKGKPVCVLVKTPDNLVIQIGLPGATAEIDQTYDSGTRETPGSAMKFTAEAYAHSLCYYEGTITLDS